MAMKRIFYRFLLITWIFSMYYVPSVFADNNPNLLLEDAIEYCNLERIKIALNQGADPQAHYKNNPTAKTYYEMVGFRCWDRFGNSRIRYKSGVYKAPNKTGPNKSSSHILEIYKLLIKHSENFDFKEEPLPWSAVDDNWDTVVKYFLDNGVNPDKRIEGDYPLEIALKNKHNNIYDLLIKYGATPLKSYEINALKLNESVKANDKDKIEELISQGVDINLPTKGGISPLYSTMELYLLNSKENYSMISYLLSKGADVNEHIYRKNSSYSLGSNHFQVLHMAMMFYSSKFTKEMSDDVIKLTNLFVENGADVSGVNSRLQTPLHCAVISDNIKGAEILLGKEAGVNNKDEDGNPPIAYSESVEMSNLLRKYGAKDAVKKEPGLEYGLFPLCYLMVEATLKQGEGHLTEMVQRQDLWEFWWIRGFKVFEPTYKVYLEKLHKEFVQGELNMNQVKKLAEKNKEQFFMQYIYDNWDEINKTIMGKPE